MRKYTNFEESKKLFEAGLPRRSASQVYASVMYEGRPENGDDDLNHVYYDEETDHFYYIELLEDFMLLEEKEPFPDIPCWTIGDLLDLLPDSISCGNNKCDLEFDKTRTQYEYYDDVPMLYENPEMIVELVDSVLWLMKNNKLNQ